MTKQPNLVVDIDKFEVVRDSVGVGKIVELTNHEVRDLAPFMQNHPGTIYAVSSGLCLTHDCGHLQKGEYILAIEWARQEMKPQPKEPEVNVYRFIFGVSTNDGTCVGYDVTRPFADPAIGQVGDHWSKFDEVVSRHFPRENLD